MTNNEELQEIIRATGAAHVAPIPYPPIRLRPHGEDLVALYWTEFRDRLERKGHEALVVLHDRLESHEEELLERYHEVRERTANMHDREKVREVQPLLGCLHDTWGLVNFRRTVLANLLWQYEVFGSVPANASDLRGGAAVRDDPFDGTIDRYEHCTRLIDAWEAAEPKPKKMRELWALVRNEGAVEQAARRALKDNNMTYEHRIPTSFISALMELMEEHNATR